MNKVILTGRLARDPYIIKGTSTTAKFTMAITRDEDHTDYPSCVAWGKTAELIGKYLHKGSLIAAEGRVQTGSYEKDGQTIYTTDIAVRNIEFLEKKSDGKKEDPEDPREEEAHEEEFEAVDEDLPF